MAEYTVNELKLLIDQISEEMGAYDKKMTKQQIDFLSAQQTRITNIVSSIGSGSYKGGVKADWESLSKSVNSSMASLKTSLSDVTKEAGSFMDNINKAGLGLIKTQFSINENITFWKEFAKQVNTVGVNVGITSNRFESHREQMRLSAKIYAEMGGNTIDLITGYKSLSNEIGRSVPISPKIAESMRELEVVAELSSGQVGILIGRLSNLNMGIDTTAKIMEDLRVSSELAGLNTSKVLNNLIDNVGRMQEFSFRDGVKGMMEMAKNAEKTRLSISETLTFADKLFDPENAMETAASLQMLGGSFAQMADPMQLMYDAMAQPEELMKKLQGAVQDLGQFNRDTGKLDLDPAAAMQLREMAKITGQSAKNLMEAATAGKKLEDIKMNVSFGRNLNDDQLSTLSTLAEFKGGEYKVKVKDERTGKEVDKSITELSDEDIIKLSESLKTDSLKDAVFKTMTADEIIVNQLTGAKFNTLDIWKGSGLDKLSDNVTTGLLSQGGALSQIQKTMDEMKTNIFIPVEKIGESMGGAMKVINAELGLFVEIGKEMASAISGIDSKTIHEKSGKVEEYISNLINKIGGIDTKIGEKQNDARLNLGQKTYERPDGSFSAVPISPPKKSLGGLLPQTYGNQSLSHGNGGIIGMIGGKPKVELEGGEAIVNTKSSSDYSSLLSLINEKGGGAKFSDNSGILSELTKLGVFDKGGVIPNNTNNSNTFENTQISNLNRFDNLTSNLSQTIQNIEGRRPGVTVNRPGDDKSTDISIPNISDKMLEFFNNKSVGNVDKMLDRQTTAIDQRKLDVSGEVVVKITGSVDIMDDNSKSKIIEMVKDKISVAISNFSDNGGGKLLDAFGANGGKGNA